MEKVPIDELIRLIKREYDEKRLNLAIERQKAVQNNLDPDYIPVFLYGKVPEMEKFPSYDRKQQFYDPEKMLYTLLWGCLSILRGKGDNIPCVRVNFGTGFLATVFGLQQEVFPDKMPWLKAHLGKDEILKTRVEDLEPVEKKGLMPEWIRYTEFYKEKLKEVPFVRMYLPDTQGVFDLAHLVAGDRIFTDFYDDQKFIEYLLNLTTHVYVSASVFMKNFIGEPLSSGFHNEIVMANAGVRTCEDTTTLLSPDLFKIVYPYFERSISKFGAFLHFCGSGSHLMEVFLSCPYVKIINFGNPERFNWNETMKTIAKHKKTYFGTVKRLEEETLTDYFSRVLEPLERKSNLMFVPQLKNDEDPGQVIEIWHNIQDKKFSKTKGAM
ncbi:MAG: hypothetical protein NC913_08540 [Candidatus Omnitrophica bacterium]|nr:hypothetical protein [Candidatus Omnitrophota bacterium]